MPFPTNLKKQQCTFMSGKHYVIMPKKQTSILIGLFYIILSMCLLISFNIGLFFVLKSICIDLKMKRGTLVIC